MALYLCPHCHRHVKTETQSCPFCSTRRVLSHGAILLAGVGIATMLSACYGPPPHSLEVMSASSNVTPAGQPTDAPTRSTEEAAQK
jgi:hypothetical protein